MLSTFFKILYFNIFQKKKFEMCFPLWGLSVNFTFTFIYYFIEQTLQYFIIYSILLYILSCLSKDEDLLNKFLDKDCCLFNDITLKGRFNYVSFPKHLIRNYIFKEHDFWVHFFIFDCLIFFKDKENRNLFYFVMIITANFIFTFMYCFIELTLGSYFN